MCIFTLYKNIQSSDEFMNHIMMYSSNNDLHNYIF